MLIKNRCQLFSCLIGAGALLLAGLPTLAKAQDVTFTIGGGVPFFVVPEVSYAVADSQQRWFAQYKAGFEDGFAVGFEQGVGNNKHAIGFLVGAIGISDGDEPCTPSSSLVCAFSGLFEFEITNGAGLSYSYYYDGLDNPGWRLRFEAGYGEGNKSGVKQAGGGFTVSYQF